MGKGQNQKLKLLYVARFLLDKTDENHGVTMSEIINNLSDNGICAERKSIYTDIESLRLYGLDIICIKSDKSYTYRIANRKFEIAELKLLVDAVQSSKFITTKKSEVLIKKIEGLASCYEAKQLQRQVYVSNRVKTMNERVYYNIDTIHEAIGSNSKIRYQYFQWNVDKKMVKKKGGKYYKVSPWALTWDDENYYLVAYDGEEEKIKHFRVDKMINTEIHNERREGKQHFEKFDMAVYANKMFGMFGGNEERIKIRFENRFAGVVIDRFGKDVTMIKTDKDHFEINIIVSVSNQFFAWIIGLGKGVKIVGPDRVIVLLKDEIKRLFEEYN